MKPLITEMDVGARPLIILTTENNEKESFRMQGGSPIDFERLTRSMMHWLPILDTMHDNWYQ